MADAVIGVVFVAAAADELDGDLFTINVISDCFKRPVEEERGDGVDKGDFAFKR